MVLVKLPSVVNKERKQKRTIRLKKNKYAYKKLMEMMVPCIMSLSEFRKYYHPVLTTEEKDILLKKGIDPWSLEGLKFVGDCKRNNVKV